MDGGGGVFWTMKKIIFRVLMVSYLGTSVSRSLLLYHIGSSFWLIVACRTKDQILTVPTVKDAKVNPVSIANLLRVNVVFLLTDDTT